MQSILMYDNLSYFFATHKNVGCALWVDNQTFAPNIGGAGGGGVNEQFVWLISSIKLLELDFSIGDIL